MLTYCEEVSETLRLLLYNKNGVAKGSACLPGTCLPIRNLGNSSSATRVEVTDPSPPQTHNREDACNTCFSPNNMTPTSDTAASGRCHQHLGFKKGMAIASLNINGLRSHLDEIQLLNLGIHILALNETKLDPEFPKELTTGAGYQQERLDRTCNGGGVSIYIRDSVKYKRRLAS